MPAEELARRIQSSDWRSLPAADQHLLAAVLEQGWHRLHPDAYAEDALRVALTPDQAAILHSVATHRRTAVKASHAIGKTYCAAVAANWWYDCWPAHIVYITAPTWSQALGLTFKQIKLLRRAARAPGEVLETGIVRDLDRERQPAHFIRALNAERGEGFQGEHSAPILVILEEAVGVPPYIWSAAQGLMTHPDSRILAIANPTDEGGAFGAACGSEAWHTITASGLDHPNIAAELAGLAPPFPLAVRLQWVREMIQSDCRPAMPGDRDAFEFPPGSGLRYVPGPVFTGRVLGEFADLGTDRVIPVAWVRAARLHELRWQDGVPWVPDPDMPLVAGLDLGAASNTLVVRRGPLVVSVEQWAGDITSATWEAVLRAERAGVRVVCYDADGEGSKVRSVLDEGRRTSVRFVAVNGGAQVPRDIVMDDGRRACEVYANLRAYLWDGVLGERLRRTHEAASANVRYGTPSHTNQDSPSDGSETDPPSHTSSSDVRYEPVTLLSLPDDPQLTVELSVPLRRTSTDGRSRIEAKAEMVVRGVESPHRADALAYSFAPQPAPYAPMGAGRMDRLPDWAR